MRGFFAKIRIANSFTSECWGLREGLRMVKGLNLDKVIIEMDSVIIEMDSEITINLMNNDDEDDDLRSTLIKECKALVASLRIVGSSTR